MGFTYHKIKIDFPWKCCGLQQCWTLVLCSKKSLRYTFVLFLFLQKNFPLAYAGGSVVGSVWNYYFHFFNPLPYIRSCIPPHLCLLSFVTVFRLSVTLKSLGSYFLIFLSSLWKIILTNKIVIVHTNCAFYFAFCHSARTNMFVYFLPNWEFLVTFKEGKSK